MLDTVDDKPSELVAGRYRLKRRLAAGGMAVVWEATDTRLRRQVALKLMFNQPAGLKDAGERFEHEARVVAQLSSAHIVEVYDFGSHDGQRFLVMELLHGEDLQERLDKGGAVSLAQTANYVTQICRGLKAAHRGGVVHRDIKPGNIFITERDGEEVLKLVDFGLVKSHFGEGGAHTETGLILGTPLYLSPEQVRLELPIDHRSDLWSVAVLVHELLTGGNPFTADSIAEVLERICGRLTFDVSALNPGLPPTLDAFFTKALARDRGERFQSADQLAAALRAIAAGYGIEALGEFGSATMPAAIGERSGEHSRPPPPMTGTVKQGPPALQVTQAALDGLGSVAGIQMQSATPPPLTPRRGGTAGVIAGFVTVAAMVGGAVTWLSMDEPAGPDSADVALGSPVVGEKSGPAAASGGPTRLKFLDDGDDSAEEVDEANSDTSATPATAPSTVSSNESADSRGRVRYRVRPKKWRPAKKPPAPGGSSSPDWGL